MSRTEGALPADTCLVFVHIPKTAGTTVRSALTRVYAASERVYVYDPGVRDAVTLDALRGWDETRRAALRLMMGHFGFGTHTIVPGPTSYVTMLREPLDRIVSLFDYLRTGSFPAGSPVAAQQARLKAGHIDIADHAFESRHIRWDNHMVRLLSGRLDAPFGECDRSMLAQAMTNIERHFAGVLLQERMAASMALLEDIAGRPLPALADPQSGRDHVRRAIARIRGQASWRNATRERRSVADLEADTRARLLGLNHLDVELYDWVLARFPDDEKPVTSTGAPD